MYDDVEYLTNLNKKLKTEVDHKKNIIRHLQHKLFRVKNICQSTSESRCYLYRQCNISTPTVRLINLLQSLCHPK